MKVTKELPIKNPVLRHNEDLDVVKLDLMDLKTLLSSDQCVARNYTVSLIWRCYGPKRDILEY